MSRRLEPQDLYAIQLVEDPQITPDGERIAYVKAEIDRNTYEYHRSIWVTSASGTPGRRFSAGDNDTTPRWSPDGQSLAFLRGAAGEVKPKNEDERGRGVGKPQLWVLPADGGEARQLTWARYGVGDPEWSPDGASIVYSAEVGEPDDVRLRTPPCTTSGCPRSGRSTGSGIASTARDGSTNAGHTSFGSQLAAAMPSS